jgi:hypothetical protein
VVAASRARALRARWPGARRSSRYFLARRRAVGRWRQGWWASLIVGAVAEVERAPSLIDLDHHDRPLRDRAAGAARARALEVALAVSSKNLPRSSARGREGAASGSITRLPLAVRAWQFTSQMMRSGDAEEGNFGVTMCRPGRC